MKAVCWMGKEDVQVNEVPDPIILTKHDCIVSITSTAICGSDLHLYNGYVPTMKEYDILGHEFMGEIVEVGPEVKDRKVGDRVIVPFGIACGGCYFCKSMNTSLCDNTNPNGGQQENVQGEPSSALFGYSHMFGGYDGGQAEFARVPFADINTFVVPKEIPDEKLLFLTDVLPTGYQAAEQAGIRPGDVVAIWGCGPVGQFCVMSSLMLGASLVIAIDREPERLKLAAKQGAIPVNFEELGDEDVFETIKEMTGGRGADVCIDAVGMEALGHGAGAVLDWAKQIMRMQTDRPNVLRQAIMCCRKGGTMSIPGVYMGIIDAVNFGTAFGKGLTFKMGQTNVHKYVPKLLDTIQSGDLDPSFIISHVAPLDQAPEMYEMFRNKKDGCTKVVMRPGAFMS